MNRYSLLALALLGSPATLGQASAPGIIFNEDNSHFYGYYPPWRMTRKGLREFIDEYAGTCVSHVFMSPNAMRTSYASATWEPIWTPTPNGKVPKGKWPTHAKLLHERGVDPYAVWIDRCREVGISPWLSMRMNDAHHTHDVNHYYHSRFWREHPEYWRIPHGKGGSITRALNYGVPEVREHHMKLIRELLERYDPDGLELDWMRFGYHFAPGEEAAGCAILTEFVRDVRRLTKAWSAKRGHPVRLGARVPTRPDAAKGLGMDGVTWAREGLIDMLVPSPFWATADFDIPIETWRERLGAAAERITLAAGLELNLRGHPRGKTVHNDLASVRGFAAAMLHRGADRIYLFNYLSPAPIPGGRKAYRQLLEVGLSLSAVTAHPRRHVVTFPDTVPKGYPRVLALPKGGHDSPEFHLYIGPAPAGGNATLVVGLGENDGVAAAGFQAEVNEAACTAVADLARDESVPELPRFLCFDCPVDALRPGRNHIRLDQKPGQPEQTVEWLELRIDPRR